MTEEPVNRVLHTIAIEGSDINEKKIVFHEPNDGRV